jgi:hypothetical protein
MTITPIFKLSNIPLGKEDWIVLIHIQDGTAFSNPV